MPVSRPMKDYKKYIYIPALPEEVYQALTTEATVELWTGEKAEITASPGAEFSMWSGNISGKMLELEKSRKIVQQWYFGDREPASVVTIILHPDKKGTSLELRHTNIPEEDFEDMVSGWNEVYFASLTEFYEEE
jgi:activator of HSP90 ATPase